MLTLAAWQMHFGLVEVGLLSAEATVRHCLSLFLRPSPSQCLSLPWQFTAFAVCFQCLRAAVLIGSAFSAAPQVLSAEQPEVVTGLEFPSRQLGGLDDAAAIERGKELAAYYHALVSTFCVAGS